MTKTTAILLSVHNAGYIVRRRRNPDAGGFYEAWAVHPRTGERWIVRARDGRTSAKWLAIRTGVAVKEH